MADIFPLGFIGACSLASGLFFLRFWRSSHDTLFLAFAVFFIVEGGSNAIVMNLAHPNHAGNWIFGLRLLAVLGVLGAILWKNAARS